MNRFFTLFLAAFCLTAVGQVEISYPYNPDNGDGAIGSPDLIELLTLYGTLFEPEALMVNEIPFQDWVDAVNNTLLSQQALIDSLMGNGVNQTDPCEGLTSVNYHGVEYSIVAIGDQCWFAKDLMAEQYNDGTFINDYNPYPWLSQFPTLYSNPDLFVPVGIEEDEWGIYAPYVGSEGNEKKVCPVGWKVPELRDIGILWEFGKTSSATNNPFTVLSDLTEYSSFNLQPNWNYEWRQWQGFNLLSSENWVHAFPSDLCEISMDLTTMAREIKWRCHLDSLYGDCDALQSLVAEVVLDYGYDPDQANLASSAGCNCNNLSYINIWNVDCLDPDCEESICEQNHLNEVLSNPRGFMNRSAMLYSDYQVHLDAWNYSSKVFFPQQGSVYNIGYGEVGPLPTFIWHDNERALPPEQTVEEIMTPFTRLPIRCLKD